MKSCCSNTESEGHAAAPNHSTEEGSRAGPSTLVNLDAVSVSVPACPEEEGCRQPEERSNTLQSLMSLEEETEKPEPSSYSKNKASLLHKEEEEEPSSAINSGVISEASDGKLSPEAGLEGAVDLLYCTVKQKDIGMNSPDLGLEQGNLGDQSNFHQEVETVEERTAGSASELPTSCDAGMGQSECRSCAGNVDGPAVIPQHAENGDSHSGLSVSKTVEGTSAVWTDPTAPCFVDNGKAVTCRGKQSAGPQSNGNVAIDPDTGPVESSGCQMAGADLQVDTAKHHFPKCLEDPELPAKEVQRSTSSPKTEAVAENTAAEGDPVLEANNNGQQTGAGMVVMDLKNNNSGAKVENGRPDVELEAAWAGDRIGELRADGQPEQKTCEQVPPGTETPSHGCGGSADSTSLHQGGIAACHAQKEQAGKDEFGSASELGAGPASASEPVPSCLSPAVPSSAKEEPLRALEVAENSCKMDQFSQSTEDILVVASALLDEVIQQAQLIVAKDGGATAAPAGQEASPHLEDLALPLRGEGTECVQGNLMGTPSAVHNKESKQNQEVTAEAASQPTALAEQGSPLPDELTTGTLLPVDHPEKNKENGSLSQPSASKLGRELPGEEERFPKAPALESVAQSPLCDRGEELQASDGNTEPGLKVGACSPEADKNVKTGAAAGGSQGPEGASVCAHGAPCPPATMLNQELDLSSDAQVISSPCRAPFFMDAPLASCELPALAELPRDGEEVGNVSPRVLLQPIAEEPPCDCDSGTEVFFLASEEGSRPEVALSQPNEGRKEERKAEPESQLLTLSPCIPAEQAGAKDSVSAAEGTFVDNMAENPSQTTMPRDSLGSVVGNPTETSPLMESRSDDQHVTDANPISDGETDLSLQSGGSMKRAANLEVSRPFPVTDALEVKAEEGMDFLRGLAENGTSEAIINRESWCPVESSPDPSLLKTKRACNSAESSNFLEDELSGDCTLTQDLLKRESGSKSHFFPLPSDGMDEIDFGKHEEEQSAGDSTSSSSSADDTISLERNSSLGSDTSLPQALNLLRPKDRYSLDGAGGNMASAEGPDGEFTISGELEEELDSITEVPPHSSALRNSMRPLSPFRRHSWGPGKNASSEAEINHRSSMRVLGDVAKKPPTHRRSLSWCPSGVQCNAVGADLNGRSYSLEGLAGDADHIKKPSSSLETASLDAKDLQKSPLASDERGSLVSLTEEELESEQVEERGFDLQRGKRSQPRAFSFCTHPVASPLTKSTSLMAITQAGPDSSRPFGGSSSNAVSQGICEESCNFLPPSPSRKDLEGKSGTKVSRTFSYLKNKMSSGKKSKEKEREKEKTKDRDAKEKDKDKKTINGHAFSAIRMVGPIVCFHCSKNFNKDSFVCGTCDIIVHKSCMETVNACGGKARAKKGGLQTHDTSSLPTVIMRNKSSQPKERPRSAILAPDETAATAVFNSRRSQQNISLSKSVSIQNIAGVGNDEAMLHTWKFLSQSTDSLNKISRVNESMESLTDEGADMNDDQLMGDFEVDSKQLEAESWSLVVDSKFTRQQKEDVVKRQDVIYELMQTEMHHVRTLKIMSDVYSRGMVQELQFEQQMVEKVFPCLDDLLVIHTQFFQRILERKKESLVDRSDKNFLIWRIGDILVNQFSGENAERMKKTYGKFCGHQNEAVNYFKDLYSKEKRFQAFMKKKMSSSVVRRLGIPECILLVTQRITKYPVLLQRILQHTTENDKEQEDLVQSLNLVKEVIVAVNSKVSKYEKKTRLNEIYTRTDSKSIMRMKSGQMFAREDLRRRKFVRDGQVSLKNAAGRLKEVQAVLLSDVLIFLQEKDQKYIFASLDQKSTVVSLKKLIVREVAHEEKGLFLISMGGKDPEMVEVHASSKEERNSWIQIIQDTINTMDKDEDEGVPSESEEEKRVLDIKARELREQLLQKDQQIIALLQEKEKIFRCMTDCSGHEDSSGTRTLFRANTDEAPKGESIIKNVISEVELLQRLVSRSLGNALGQQICNLSSEEEGVGPVSLPRRAETFGGFDSHQMNVCKGGDRDEGDDIQDLRRTESDSVLKKGGTANLMLVLKRNNEQVLQSITHLHSLLGTLQAVVVQQDSYIEDQKLLLTERVLSRGSFRPNSLIEQEKQRSLEKQRQELANLQKQQAQHQEEKRKRERKWEVQEKELVEREAQLAQQEEQAQKALQSLEKEREELQQKKAAYQLDLEHLRAAQKQLEKEKEQLKRDTERIPQVEPGRGLLSNQHTKVARTPSMPVSEDSSSKQLSSSLPKQTHGDTEISISPKRSSVSRTHKEKSTFHLLGTTASNQTSKPAEGHGQMPNRLFSLTKAKDKKEKKKKGKGHRSQPSDAHSPEGAPEGEEIFC
ncbi:A-kinase anchor protein 13 isoform X2 [Eublepharis macularius]|uniref:A-kinase anchor protein 13 isoform X2 n=1 Tax=Eublepharis macularius TaxID=481883 RepID=A0AA97KMQ7_EUBMA|nr:A-kinase anchor protein 13 isoform X2 [Eublepharis macularius]